MRSNVHLLDYPGLYYCIAKDGMHYLGALARSASNWYDVALFRAGARKSVVAHARNGKDYRIDSTESYLNFMSDQHLSEKEVLGSGAKVSGHTVSFNYNGKKVRFYFDDAQQFTNTASYIDQNFVKEVHRELDVKGKDVVDIGANVGDTAIYFAMKGAKHVYAFEPFPYSYEIAKKNIALNKLQDKITLVNAGCGKSCRMSISTMKSYGDYDLSAASRKGKSKSIRIFNLQEIVKQYGLRDAAIKMDCEGCEYDLLLGADDKTLSHFSSGIIEFHYGYLDIQKKLASAGFRVGHRDLRMFFNAHMGKRMLTGTMAFSRE